MPLGITQTAFAGRLGISLQRLNDRGVAMGDPAYYPAFNDIDQVHYPFYAGAPASEIWVTGWVGVGYRRPSVDGCQPTHVYDYFIQGRGAGLALRTDHTR